MQDLPLPTTQTPPQQPQPTSTSRSLPPRSNCSNLTRKESELQGTGDREIKQEIKGRRLASGTHIAQTTASLLTPKAGGAILTFLTVPLITNSLWSWSLPQAPGNWAQSHQQPQFHWYQFAFSPSHHNTPLIKTKRDGQPHFHRAAYSAARTGTWAQTDRQQEGLSRGQDMFGGARGAQLQGQGGMTSSTASVSPQQDAHAAGEEGKTTVA